MKTNGVTVTRVDVSQYNSSAAKAQVEIEVDDAAVRKQHQGFNGLERPKVWDNVSNTWRAATYVGAKKVKDEQGVERTVDKYVCEIPGTTDLLLHKDTFKVAVVADSNVGLLTAQEPGQDFPAGYKAYQLRGGGVASTKPSKS